MISTPKNPNNYTFSSLLFCGKVGYVTILIEREEGEGEEMAREGGTRNEGANLPSHKRVGLEQ